MIIAGERCQIDRTRKKHFDKLSTKDVAQHVVAKFD